MLSRISFLFFLLFSLDSSAQTEPLPEVEKPAENSILSATGRIFTDQYVRVYRTANTETFAQSSFTTWLALDTRKKQSINFHGVGSATFFLKSLEYPKTSRGDFRLREGFLSYSTDSVEVKAGQQIIPWGKSDGVNPTDYWTAKDFTVLNPDEEVRRVGAPSVSFSFTPQDGASPFNIILIAQGNYPTTKLLISDSALPPLTVPIQKYPASRPYLSADTFEFGGKISYLMPEFDFSLSAFRGFSQMPHYEFNGTSIFSTYSRETAFGGDLSFTFDTYVVRLESAARLPDNGSDSDPLFGLVEPKHWDTVLGLERPLFTDFRIQVQALYRHHFSFLSPNSYVGKTPIPQIIAIQQAVGRANALILNYIEQDTLGGTFRFAYQPEIGNWTADVFFMGYFGTGNDFSFRPQTSYKPYEGFKLVAGADIYGGASTRTLGSMRSFSVYFFEARWMF